MSMYSGKCDFFDSMFMIHECSDEELANSNIYIGYPEDLVPNSCVQLDIKNEYEAAPLFPHIIRVSMTHNGHREIYLTEKPYYDIVDEERTQHLVEDIGRAIRSLKRRKKKVTKDSIKDRFYYTEPEWLIDDMIDDVINKRKPAMIHRAMGKVYRREHFNKLVELGYPESAAYLITHHDKTE